MDKPGLARKPGPVSILEQAFDRESSFCCGMMKQVIMIAGLMVVLSQPVTAQLLLVGRGTRSKAAVISALFNENDNKLTHIGIGFFEGNDLFIAHVTDEQGPGKSALVIESAASFFDRPDVQYRYMRVLPGFLQDEQLFKKILSEFISRKIVFDKEFVIGNGRDKLYCSEFCVEVINKLSDGKDPLWPKCLILEDGFIRKLVNRPVIHYFPTDIAQARDLFQTDFFRLPRAGRR